MSMSIRFFLSWLIIAVMISESTKAYKDKNWTIIVYQRRICWRDADGRLIQMGMIVHPEAKSSMWWLQQLETFLFKMYYHDKKPGSFLSVGQRNGAWRRTNISLWSLFSVNLCRWPANCHVSIAADSSHSNLNRVISYLQAKHFVDDVSG